MSSTSADRHPGVVVGYDGSPGSRAALEWAIAHANACRLPLDVRSVVEPPGAFAIDVLGEDGRDDARVVAERMALEGVGVARRSARVPVTGSAVVGHASAGLVDGSDEAALLVVGAHGAGSGGMLAAGSVAFAVTVDAGCPVVVVHGTPPRLPGPRAPVVVGVDGSRSSAAAVLQGADLAARTRAELVLVAVWRESVVTRWGPRAGATGPGGGVRPHRDAAQSAVGSAADRVRHVHPEVRVQENVLEGYPARVLLDLSTSAGVIVVGSRGWGGVAGLLLGSVARRLVHDASCSVMVVRRVPEPRATAAPAVIAERVGEA